MNGGAWGDTKRALRAAALRRRAGLTPAEHATAAATLAAVLVAVSARAPGPVAAYASVGSEPATGPLLAALPSVLLPVLLPDGDLDWAPYEGVLEPGPRGLPVPPGPRLGRDALAACALVVVPALAVDRTGTRLGRGGGSYDRALLRTSGRVLAALHTGELVEALPADAHDRPVHGVVLPDRGLVALRPYPDAPPSAAPGKMER